MVEIMIIVPRIAFRNDSHHASYNTKGRLQPVSPPLGDSGEDPCVLSQFSDTQGHKRCKVGLPIKSRNDVLGGFFHLLKEAGSTV